MRTAAVVTAIVVCMVGAGLARAEIGYGPIVMDDPTVLDTTDSEFRLDIIYRSLGEEVGGFLYGTPAADVADGDDEAAPVTPIDADWLAGIGIDYGATDRLEVGAWLPFVRTENGNSSSGLGDLVLKAKVGLLDGTRNGIVLSGAVNATIDTGDEDIVGAENETEVLATFLLSKKLAVWNLYLNFGYLDTGVDNGDGIAYGIAAEIPGENMDLVFELTGSDVSVGEDDPSAIYAGFRKESGEKEDFALTVGSGLSDASPDLIVQLVYRYAF